MSKKLPMKMNNPMEIQKHIRDNSTEIQNMLSEISSWSVEMKAKELAESGADLMPLENVPVRSDPKKSKKSSSRDQSKKLEMNGDVDPNLSSENKKGLKKVPSADYSRWEKFDAEKACEELDESKEKRTESEEDIIRRKAIQMRLSKVAVEKKDQGNQFLKERDYVKAVECYSEGIRIDKNNAVLYANRAQAYLLMKQYEKAITDCSECLKNDTGFVKAYFRRAKARFELGKLNDAKNDLNQALKLEPSNADSKKLLSEINKKTMQSLFGGPGKEVKESSQSSDKRPSSTYGGIRTVLGNNLSNHILKPSWMDDDEDEIVSGGGDSNEFYPKKILPVNKAIERRSKRPLLPVHVNISGGSNEKKMRLDYNGNEGNSGSISNNSSVVSSPATVPSSPVTLCGPATTPNISSPSTLPKLFSQLKMTSIPCKAKTAAQFNNDWKKLKPYPDMCAQYLKQMDSDDYLIFQNSMEYTILSDILDLLVWEFLPQRWDITKHLQGLLTVRRFNTLLMFMTEKDRANIRKLISECPSSMEDDLKNKYGV